MTVETPGPSANALKENVVKIEMRSPPINAYSIPFGLPSSLRLNIKYKKIAMVNDPAWKIRLLKKGSLRFDPSLRKRSEIAPVLIAPSAKIIQLI